MKTSLLRAGAAIATSAVCLLALAGPASATTENVNLTGGNINVGAVNGSGGDDFPIGGEDGPCSDSPATITVEVGTSPKTNKIWLTNLSTEALIQVGSSWYYVTMEEDLTLGATDGNYTYSPPTRNITDLQVGVVANIYNAADDDQECAGDGAPLCTAATIVELDGTFTGDGKTTGDTFTLSGADTTSGLQPWPTCGAGPFLTNERVNVTGLTGTVV